jgi:hypothetical protein
MKHTNFFSKAQAQRFHEPIGREDRVLISITTPNKPDSFAWNCHPAVLHDDTWKDVLRLEFDDVDPGHMNSEQASLYRLFNEDDAVKVLRFLKQHEADTMNALVHCEAGISRSAAVSKFISHVYSLPFPEGYSVYNKHVFSTLLRVYGEALYLKEGPISPEELPGYQGDPNA